MISYKKKKTKKQKWDSPLRTTNTLFTHAVCGCSAFRGVIAPCLSQIYLAVKTVTILHSQLAGGTFLLKGIILQANNQEKCVRQCYSTQYTQVNIMNRACQPYLALLLHNEASSPLFLILSLFMRYTNNIPMRAKKWGAEVRKLTHRMIPPLACIRFYMM